MRWLVVCIFGGLFAGCAAPPQVPKVEEKSGLERAVERAREVRAMAFCGEVYNKGMTPELSTDKNVELMRQSADGGRGTCQIVVGRWYEEGFRVAQSYAAAREWFEKSIATTPEGYAELARLAELGRGQPQDLGEALRLNRLGVDRGDTAATLAVARFHAQGLGIPRDAAAAAEWYRKVAYSKRYEPNKAAAWTGLIELHKAGLVESREQLQLDERTWRGDFYRKLQQVTDEATRKYGLAEQERVLKLKAGFSAGSRYPQLVVVEPSSDPRFDAAMVEAIGAIAVPPVPMYVVDKAVLESMLTVKSPAQPKKADENGGR